MSTFDVRLIDTCRVATALTLLLSTSSLAASFVYEGRLDDHGAPANGRYELTMQAFGDPHSAYALAEPTVFNAVVVEDGRFRLEFELPIAASDAAWLQLSVRESGGQDAPSSLPGRSKAAAAMLIGQCWSSTGDADTDPALNFLGTTDDQPMVLRSNNAPVLRLIGGLGSDAANIVGGSPQNSVSPANVGQTVAGGGHNGTTCGTGAIGSCGNTTEASFATVSGGYGNTAAGSGSSIGGGQSNFADAGHSTVAGGQGNMATSPWSTLTGGLFNTASGNTATVSGGASNCAGASYSWVGGAGAKVRPGSTAGAAGSGCTGVESGGVNGDRGHVRVGRHPDWAIRLHRRQPVSPPRARRRRAQQQRNSLRHRSGCCFTN